MLEINILYLISYILYLISYILYLILNHFSCIDHFIMSKNVFDFISKVKHNLIIDVQNPSSRNILSLSLVFKVMAK